MRPIIGLIATLGLVGLGVVKDGSPVSPTPAVSTLARTIGALQEALGEGSDAEMARAFLDAMTGANPVACTLSLRGVSNGWGGYGSMTTLAGIEGPSPEERQLLQWARERRFDDDAVEPLTEALSHADPCRREAAAVLFGHVDEGRAVEALEPVVRSGDLRTRIAALTAMGHVEAASSVATLERGLADVEHRVRQVSAWALGRVEDRSAVPTLVAALGDPDAGVRGNVAWALGQIEDGEAIDALATVLQQDGVAEVRINAAWALGQIEDTRAIPSLTQALGGDDHPLVRKAAAWALGQMS